jgi:hypothetical protein
MVRFDRLEAFPFEASRKYLIFDRDQKFEFEVIAAVKTTRIIPKRTSFRSPWQNGIAERWVGSCRRVVSMSLDADVSAAAFAPGGVRTCE